MRIKQRDCQSRRDGKAHKKLEVEKIVSQQTIEGPQPKKSILIKKIAADPKTKQEIKIEKGKIAQLQSIVGRNGEEKLIMKIASHTRLDSKKFLVYNWLSDGNERQTN